MLTIRCSSLPLAFACPPAVLDGEGIRVSRWHEASDVGSAGHDIMQRIVIGSDIDIDAVARRWAVDPDEISILSWYGRQAWRELEPSFRDAETEVEVTARIGPGVTLIGHIDLLARSGTVAHVGDWKTGRVARDHMHQLSGYAVCIFYTHPEIEKVVFTTVWLRDQEVETHTYTRRDAAEWVERLKAVARTEMDSYRTGDHCEHCPRSHGCPALIAVARRDVAVFSRGDLDAAIEQGLAAMGPAEILELRRRKKIVDAVSESLGEAIRRRVREAGGALSDGETSLVLVQENGPREIDPLKAWDVMEQRLTTEEIAACIKVRASKLDDAVKAKAPKGKGAAAVRELKAALEAAGAVEQPKVEKLKEFRVAKEIANG